MSIATVVTRGYGAFGSVNKLPTWGYGIGAGVVSPAYETQRHTLYGTSLERHSLTGTSLERHSLASTSLERQTLSGSTP
jgi:hypothetical protein